MTSPTPRRADIVGSFLRPAPLADARRKVADGDLGANDLRLVEDEQIARLVDQQVAAGLDIASDGEFRRSWWHFDFYDGLEGVEVVELDHGIQFQGVQTKPRGVRITDRIGFGEHPFLDHFAFLNDKAAAAGVTPKFTLPSPTVFDFRLESDQIVGGYASRAQITDDLIQTYRDALGAFYAVGARYLQLDDTAWAYLCSPEELAKAESRGLDTANIADRYADILAAILDGKPDDLLVTTHVCRGNFRSTWISSGGYEPVAEPLLARTGYDGFFLEYDSDRAGGFEPLRHLPEGHQRVVLGLITSKSGELEAADDILARIDEAARFAPRDQLALSPQCGFASTEEGNLLTEAEQWAKVRAVVDIAQRAWPE